ncbi:uncharacterized protein LOC117119013 [Anneissia japonica]|uniref:uncharacterized protein LOC117119013 n=1 Tax=Anneissia japonica TaxID=1529436 RepID=UPI0014258FCE|nr:uncharacterized protein LOC117119013 [Anneissia japonica]
MMTQTGSKQTPCGFHSRINIFFSGGRRLWRTKRATFFINIMDKIDQSNGRFSYDNTKRKISVVKDLFQSDKVVKMCAPMVRYSKLAFRTLVRRYDCDLAYTPMIVSNSFVRSVKARDSEFTTNTGMFFLKPYHGNIYHIKLYNLY